MKKNLIIWAALVFVGIQFLFGNGGPVDEGTLIRTGSVRPLEVSSIELVSEILNIKVEGDYSLIDVKYDFSVRYNPEELILYGFPVDYGFQEFEEGLKWQEDLVSNFSMELNGEVLEVSEKEDVSIHYSRLEEDYLVPGKRKWFLTKLDMRSGEKHELTVSYKVKNRYSDIMTSKSFFVGYSGRSFTYDMGPASFWGSSKLLSLEVKVDLSEADTVFRIEGFPFKLEGKGIYRFSGKNVDLTPESQLNFTYDNSSMALSAYIAKTRLDNQYISNISASSSLKGDYDPQNLIDQDYTSAWVEGKPGIGLGESIEIDIAENARVGAILLVNGYTKNDKVYRSNARVKKIKLEVLMKGSSNEPDWVWQGYKDILLKDLPFEPLDRNNIGRYAQLASDLGEGYIPIKKIKITILEAYPGVQFDDLCISEVLLLGFVNKE